MRIHELQMCVYVGKYGYDIEFAGAGGFFSAAHTPENEPLKVGQFLTRYLFDGYDNYYYESYKGSYASKEVDVDESVFLDEKRKAIRRKKARIKKLDSRREDKRRIMLVSETEDGFQIEYMVNEGKEIQALSIGDGRELICEQFKNIVIKIVQ